MLKKKKKKIRIFLQVKIYINKATDTEEDYKEARSKYDKLEKNS